MYLKNDLDEAVNAIVKQSSNEESVQFVKVVIDQGDSLKLVKGIIDAELSIGLDLSQAIYQTMNKLELFADVSKYHSCLLMSKLWGIAGDNFMHDVCDAIALWIADLKNKNERTSQPMALDVPTHLEK